MGPLRPAETGSALPIAGMQGLGGELLVLHLVAMGEVTDAQVERINADGIGEFIHRRFQCSDAGGGTQSAHVARRRNVELANLIGDLDVVAGVSQR